MRQTSESTYLKFMYFQKGKRELIFVPYLPGGNKCICAPISRYGTIND